MELAEFWRLIDDSRAQADGDQDAQADALSDQLMALSADEIVSFDTHFRSLLKAAKTSDVFIAATIIDGFWVSTDSFQDFRSWLVSRGRKVFEGTLANPDSLADVLNEEDDCALEAFCYIPGRVWEEKTGRDRQEMYGNSPPPFQSSGLDGPEETTPEEVQRRFPRLCAKFGVP